MEWEGEIRFVTSRSDAWNWKERLQKRAGTSGVSEDVHSCQEDSVVKEGSGSIEEDSTFLQKDSVLGGQIPETISDTFQQTPVRNFLKKNPLDLYC